jgi:hypothetical protein
MMVDSVSSCDSDVDCDSATVILQLFDNSIYMVGGPGGKKKLPFKDRLPH